MNREQMIEALKDVEMIEHDFNRKLTNEELGIMLRGGYKALFEKWGLNDDGYRIMLKINNIISALFTGFVDEYKVLVTQDNEGVLPVLKTIISDLEYNNCEKESVSSVIEPLEDDSTNDRYFVGCDYGYLEQEDKDVNKYFTKEAQDEANELIDAYVPEHDHELLHRFDKEDDERTCDEFEAVCGIKEKSILDRLTDGETLELTPDQFENVVTHLNCSNKSYSIKSVNNKVSLKIF